MTNTTNIIRTTKRTAVLFATAFVTCAVAFGAIEAADPGFAQAASTSKKAQEATKRMGKSFDYLIEAGKKAQAKRGVGGSVGKAMTNVGKGGSKVTKGLEKGIKNVKGGVDKTLAKSKTGRAVQNGMKKAADAQNKAIDKAFKICNGKVCDAGKNVAKFIAPF
jgi:hypothetical protein